MNKQAVTRLAWAFVLSYATAGIGGALTELGPWYFSLQHPAWKPPDAAFGVIWTTLFTLGAISGWLAWQAADTAALRRRVVALLPELKKTRYSGQYLWLAWEVSPQNSFPIKLLDSLL